MLRRTTGPVESLSARVAGDHLGVSGITERSRGSDGDGDIERTSAALHARSDLRVVDAPVTFEDTRIRFTMDRPCGRTHVLFAREDGGALVVATGGVDTCSRAYDLSGEHSVRTCCNGWNEFHVEPGGRFTTHAPSMIAPDGAPRGFARVPGGVVYSRSSDESPWWGFDCSPWR